MVEVQAGPYTDAAQLRENVVWSRIGDTPLLPLHTTLPDWSPALKLAGKAEWYNPAGSVKDRPAAHIMRAALASGKLQSGVTFLDSTSGNMGIAYATLGAAVGLPVHLVIPENAGRERLDRLRALGVNLTLSDPLEGTEGAREVAAAMVAAKPDQYYFADQYNNEANWKAHFEGTGPEIWQQTGGQITHLVAGMGTTGTITGAGRYLKSQNPDIQIIAVQPAGPLHGLEGLKHLDTSVVPGIYDAAVIDGTIEVSTEASYQLLRDLAMKRGLLLGISSGAALVATYTLASRLEHGHIVVILPDSGIKYLSLPFWSET